MTTEPQIVTLAAINAAIREHAASTAPIPAHDAPAAEWLQFRAGRVEHWARTAELWAMLYTAEDLDADTPAGELLLRASVQLEAAAHAKRAEWEDSR